MHDADATAVDVCLRDIQQGGQVIQLVAGVSIDHDGFFVPLTSRIRVNTKHLCRPSVGNAVIMGFRAQNGRVTTEVKMEVTMQVY